MIIKRQTASVTPTALRSSQMEGRWFQVGYGIILSVVLPAMIVALIWPTVPFWSTTMQNSVIASSVAFAGGLLWYRRLVRHPGVQGVENVLSGFIITFAAAAMTLLLFRLEYSRIYLSVSFAVTISGFAIVATRLSMVERLHFFVVPFGSLDRLAPLVNASWTSMRSPAIPQESCAGIVADLRADIPDEWQRLIAKAVLAGIPVFHIKQIEEALSGRVHIEHLSENQFGSLLPSLGYRKIKTLLDQAVAVLLLPIFAFPFMIVAAYIKLDSPGPIFFKQNRVGLNGKFFSMYKFRSMRVMNEDLHGEDSRSAAMTRSNDDRITRFGRFIRHYRIDELPQIINVLRGDMSWIGPRPEAVPLSQWYLDELPFYEYRHIVKPGLTGWAQINQGHVTGLEDVHEKLRFDFYYIKHFSIWLDVLIAIRTIRIVLRGFGAK